VLLDRPDLEAFCLASGWELKPEGLCRDEVCVPLPEGADLHAVSKRMGMPLVHDAVAGLWAIGPPAGPHALSSAKAPDLVLPDLDGNPFGVRDLRGNKVLLLAWASW